MILELKILTVLMIGSTHYVDIGKNTDAVIYYPSDTTAFMTLPEGSTMQGAVQMQDDGYRVKWADGPEGNWKITFEPGKMTYIGPDGKPAGTITKIVPGNPENFGE